MGKRDDNSGRRSRKHKRSRNVSKPETTDTKAGDESEPITENEAPTKEDVAEEVEVTDEVELELSGNDDADVDIEVNDEEAPQRTGKILEFPSLSQRIKKPAPTSSNTSVSPSSTGKKVVKKRRNSGTSSEEERWLTAIESGKLDDVDDELRKIKDPKLMTARQRAMYDRTQDREPSPGVETLMALPTGYREKDKPQTAEEIQKAVLKSQKRKQQADERREKDKKKTMDRLLKKQESNKLRSGTRNKQQKPTEPMITYRITHEGTTIQMPEGYEFPLKAQTACDAPKPQLCTVAGCGNRKVYNCAKTQKPLCSLVCYQKNLTVTAQ